MSQALLGHFEGGLEGFCAADEAGVMNEHDILDAGLFDEEGHVFDSSPRLFQT